MGMPRPRRSRKSMASGRTLTASTKYYYRVEAATINNNGDVVGYSKGPRGMRAFLWTQATGMQNLGVLPGGNSSQALGINDKGTVVGSSTSSSGDRAFIWTKQAGMTDLNSAESIN